MEGLEKFVVPRTDSDKLFDSGSSSDFEKQELEDKQVDL